MDKNNLAPISQEQMTKFEPKARMMAANGIAQSLSFTSERKYLNGISSNTQPFALEIPQVHRIDMPSEPFWVHITQIGKPVENSAEMCFTAIQKILSSCFIPHKDQLIFLINVNKGCYNLYLGIRSFDKNTITPKFADNLCNFIEGVWPGVKCESEHKVHEEVKMRIAEYEYVNAITGIPSMESQYKTIYPATIDTLMAGMNGKDFTYLVIADPVPENEVDGILYQCRDFCGKAESLKSFNFSENMSNSIGKTVSDAHSVTNGTSESDTKSKSRKSAWANVGAGIMLASWIFPPAGAITTALDLGASIIAGANTIAGADLFSNFSPSVTNSHTTTKNHSETDTHQESESYTQQQGKSVSQNVVNKQIEAVAEHLFYHTKRYETGKAIGCWNVGVYLMSDKMSNLQSASMQLKSIVSGQESIFEPIRVHDISDIIDDVKPQSLCCLDAPMIRIATPNGYFQHPLGTRFNDLRTLLTTKELSYFINFPLKSVPGISVVDNVPEFSLNKPEVNNDEESIDFGKLLYGGTETKISYQLPINSLAKHTLLSGINGTGKTNTVKAILNSILGSKNSIPFLIIEPAKTEYVDWAINYNKAHQANPIKIFIPGCKNYKDRETRKPVLLSELRLNPFEPVWLSKEQDPNVLTHIDRLKSTFAAAFPMYDILPVLLEDLIYTLYQSPSTNWIGKDADVVYGKTLAPTLTGMAAHVDQAIEAHGYEKRVSDNMKACLNTRIASLRRGWKKEMLDTLHSTPWEEIFGQPCIINLSYVGDDVDKSFFMSLILQFLYEYRTAQSECGQIDFNSNTCRHLTVIEEAHRVMQKCDKPEEPQYKTAMMFSNMLSEIRAYGEGMFLVDQVPTRLIPDAIKNTNTKITHRLVSEDDCRAIAEAMGVNKEQRPIIPKLLVGQCLISTALSTDKHWIKVNKVQ